MHQDSLNKQKADSNSLDEKISNLKIKFENQRLVFSTKKDVKKREGKIIKTTKTNRQVENV